MPSYDVIVVGAGSAGAPLAARLSEDGRRSVLLLEAGARYVGAQALPPELRYGGMLRAMLPGHPGNWSMVATLRDGVTQPLPRGRVVGGSSALNGTLFTRGLPEDFDGWAAEGNAHWSYDRVLPFFRKLETDHDFDGEAHGANGPIPVRRASDAELVPVDRAFLAACEDAGFAPDPDMNAPGSLGVGRLPVNTVDGIRVNSALAYLDPATDRANLEVRANVEVLRIILEGHKAVGVEVVEDGKVSTIHAGEIVLSAGAIKSPQLLMVSGIGPGEELRRVGIPVRHDLPLVGRQFTDHCSLMLPFRVPKRRSPIPDPKRGAWAHVGLHYSSGLGEHSDMMMVQSAIPLNRAIFHGLSLAARAKLAKAALGTVSARKLLDFARYGWDHAFNVLIQRGESRGEIRLRTADPTDKPDIFYHYLEDEADLRRMRDAFRLGARLLESAPYRELRAQRIAPGPEVLEHDKALNAFLKQSVGTAIHMASSCRMGPSPETAVVDQDCRVHGIDGLRVVDSSIMPTVVRRCPAATALMIGERAAALMS